MVKQKVELFMDDERRLFVRQKDGTEYEVTVFEGGGYYTAIWLRTAEEIADGIKAREENDAKWLADLKAKDKAKEEAKRVKGLAKLIMFMNRSGKGGSSGPKHQASQ